MNPDHLIEEFWFLFKASMKNFYNESNNRISRPINAWSNNLNKLQQDKNYQSIEINIRDYISLYAIDLLRHNANYHIGILITNIKRWNNISNNRFDMGDTKYINIVFLLLDIYNILTNKCMIYDDKNVEILFSTIELYIIHEDLKNFIDYAIEYNKPSIIDKITEYEYMQNKKTGLQYIENKYNLSLSPKISAKKIFNQINSCSQNKEN
jgi:hypothetical protein